MPAAARLRAVHQSESVSSARVAMAVSMRAPKRRAFSVRTRAERQSEGDGRGRPLQAGSTLRQYATGALEVDGHDRDTGAQGQIGGAAGEGLAPPVR